METLERLWDSVSNGAAAAGSRMERFLTGLFGSSNARYLRRLEPKIEAINSLEATYEAMSDAELRGQTAEFRRRLSAGDDCQHRLAEAAHPLRPEFQDLAQFLLARPDCGYLADVQMLVSNLESVLGEERFKKQVFITPKKIGAQTVEANNNAGPAAAKQILDFFQTGDVRFQVNK